MRGGLSRDERAALEALDVDGLVALLRELIAVPSLDGEESAAQRRVAAWMRRSGFEIDEWQIDLQELARHPDWCHEVDRADALGVVGWYGEPAAGRTAEGGGAGRDLLLNGHIDVVPAGDEAAWTTPPWDPAVRGGRVYGRGAVDMKGGLCCALFAVKAIHDSGILLRGRASVASVVGEEDGGTGTLADAPARTLGGRRRQSWSRPGCTWSGRRPARSCSASSSTGSRPTAACARRA